MGLFPIRRIGVEFAGNFSAQKLFFARIAEEIDARLIDIKEPSAGRTDEDHILGFFKEGPVLLLGRANALLGSDTLCGIEKRPYFSNGLSADTLRFRIPLDHPPVGQSDDVKTLDLGLGIGSFDGGQK